MMIQKFWAWVLHPPVDGPRANLLIRLMAGSVFFWEGLMKFVFREPREWDDSPSSGSRFRSSRRISWEGSRSWAASC